MSPQPHQAKSRPTQVLSAVMLWLAAVMSVAAGIQQVSPADVAQTRQAAANAARSGDLPQQRSTAASLQSRLALLSDREREALPASGFDGPDAAILPHVGTDHPSYHAATGAMAPPSATLPPRAAGFRARAPPILA